MLQYSRGQSLTDAIIGELLDEARENDLWDLASEITDAYEVGHRTLTANEKDALTRDLRRMLQQHGL